MSKTNSSEGTGSRIGRNIRLRSRLHSGGRPLVVGVATGILGGMGLYVYNRPALITNDPIWGLACMILAGIYTRLLTTTLKQSLSAAIIGVLTGTVMTIGARIAPLWLLSYTPAARELLLPAAIGRATVGLLFVFTLVYLGSYLFIVTISGFFNA
jgi:hypothetical protein